VTQTNTVTTDGKIWGPDISKWDPVKDWGALAASGARFFGAKATEGTSYTDPTFKANKLGFRQSPNFTIGVYYAFLHIEKSPKDQADLLIKAVGDLEPRERLCADFETKSYENVDPDVVKRHGLEYLDQFYAHLDASGILNGSRPLLYTSYRHWLVIGNPTWERAKFVDLWVPRYHMPNPMPPDKLPAPWANWKVFQWTDGGEPPRGTGIYHNVPGIGCCDVNFVAEQPIA